MQVVLGLIALSMTGFSVIMSFIIMAASGTSHISEWGFQIGLFPNLISAVCIGGILFMNRLMR